MPGSPLGRRPLSIGQIVEVTVGVLAQRWPTALLIAALFVVPGALATVAFGMRFDDVVLDVLPALSGGAFQGDPAITRLEAERLLGALAAYFGATVVAGLLGSIGAVALSRLLAADLRIGAGDLFDAVRTALRRSPSVIVFAVVTSAIVAALAAGALAAVLALLAILPGGPSGGPGVFGALIIGVALVVVLVYLTLRWTPAYAVMALEDAGWRRALARSWELSAERIGRILLVVAGGTLVSLVIAAVVTQLLAIVVIDQAAPLLGIDPMVAESLIVVVGAVIAAPITPLLVAVLTIDLRARRLEATAPGPTPGEARRRSDV